MTYRENTSISYKQIITEMLSACDTVEQKSKLLIEEKERILNDLKEFNEVLTKCSEEEGMPLIMYQWDGRLEGRPLTDDEKQWHRDWAAAGKPSEFRGVITVGDS